MKFKFTLALVAAIGVFFVSPMAARAQEGEPVVVDEVIAQVDDGVVTLSQLRREMKERVTTLKQNGMTDQQANDEVEKHKAELIATLINEQLLLQKGKELELTDRVEAEVNRRMLEVAKEQHINSMEKLCEAMKDQGVLCDDVRRTMRIEMMKQAVFESEVDAKLFYGPTLEELHRYFDQNSEKFKKPATVDLSEIFLNLAGKPEAEVKAHADSLVGQARGGANFAALARANSERGAEDGGKVGSFETSALRPDIAAAIKNLKAGAVSDPIKTDEGFEILHIDARTEGSDTATFNENKVREAITYEHLAKERETYLQTLRNDSYVKVADSYRASVEPLLNIVPPAAATKRSKPSKKDKNKSEKP